MQQYANIDGTYTSPRNGKVYKSEKAIRAHLSFRGSISQSNWSIANKVVCKCQYCLSEYKKPNIKNHENGCYLNPVNKIECKFCKKPILNFRTSKGTCSRSCANSYFKTGENNGNYKSDENSKYFIVCFRHHKKKCICCDEEKIVAVHHYNEDHNDDRPENLVPLCPTHHQYVHSRYRDDVIDIVDKYVVQFRNKQGLV